MTAASQNACGGVSTPDPRTSNMDDLTDGLEFLSIPTRAVNVLRGELMELNVPLPAVIAQLLAALLFVVIAIYFWRVAFDSSRSIKGLVARTVVITALAAVLSIIAVWVDHFVATRSHEIVGRVSPPGVRNLSLDLLDYRGESLGPRVQTDSTGAFVVGYTPEFADPASALVVQASSCNDLRMPLRRAHLLGAELTLNLECDPVDG